jgi:hypothetical protein
MDKTMLSVVLTIWLLLQLPVGLALACFIACPQRRRPMKRSEQPQPTPRHARAA